MNTASKNGPVHGSSASSTNKTFKLKPWIVCVTALGVVAVLLASLHGTRVNDPRDLGLDKLPLPVDGDIPNFHRVHSYLYRGAFPSTRGVDELKGLGVKTIVDLRRRDSGVKVEEIQSGLLGIKYINLPTGHIVSSETQKNFLEIVDRASKDPSMAPVFVHCAHGSDRTGYLCALWRVKHDGWSVAEAVDEMLKYGYLVHMLEPPRPRN